MIEFNELIQGTNYLKIKVEKGIKKIQHISIYAEDIHSNSIYVAINTNKYSSTDGSLGLSGDEDSVFGLAGTKNGVDAIDLAIKNGANCIVTDDENVFINYVGKITLILVKDSLIFLCELSKKIQEIKNFKVLAITGSVGKTTTTHIMYMSLKALDYKVVKSNRIRSTLLGLCIDILNVIDIDVDYFVFELQSDGVGQINKICQATKIDYAFITNIQNCHLSKFGNENNIFEEKTSIIKHLNKNGVIFVNSNDDNLCKFVKKYKDVLEIFDINFALEYIESTQFNNLYNNIKNNKHLNLTIANKFAIAFVITFLAHIKEKRFNTETIKTILKIQQPYLRYNKFIGRNNSEIIIDSYNGSFLSMEKGIVDTCKNEKKKLY